MSGLYIHIPLCRHKCYYCDFYSLGMRNAPSEQLVDALLNEARSRKEEADRITTLYIGGGTPSVLPANQLEGLTQGLRSIFDLSDIVEFTVEVNPDDVTTELVERLVATGVNRVSMGIQSFSDEDLRTIGRRHTAERALESYKLLSPVGNRSIDLIFGLPGQTLKRWEENIRRAIELRPEHISAYSLMWEPGTALSVMRSQGRIAEADEELSSVMFSRLSESLAEAGYEQYEISNYALPGYRSRHNSSYWNGESYLGLGPSAHSYDGASVRRANRADLTAYLKYFNTQHDSPDFADEEHLSADELREEYIMTRLRTAEGISLPDFEKRFGIHALRRLLSDAAPMIRRSRLLHTPDKRLHLSHEGIMIADSIISSLF